ncbi:MAG: RNA polymerase sigma factor [Candidatus Polarisedimenticolia bacterium]
MDDSDLIRRAAAGDLDAFTLLVERKRERVFRIARHVVGDRELARDVTQEVFLRLFRVLRRFREGGRFDVWLHRIAMNLAIDALRRERPHRETVPLDRPSIPGAAEPGAGPAVGPPPGGRAGADPMDVRDVRRIFLDLSARLPRKQRLAFILREIEGLSTAEVAAILKTRESTIRNHVLQARRFLQDALKRLYPEFLPGP